MTDDNMNSFEPEHLKRWWEATHRYLFAEAESLLEAAAEAVDEWSPPQTERDSDRRRYIALVRNWLLRSVDRGEKDDPLQELESAFQQQITFIARHPYVPGRLLSWLAQEGDLDIQRGVRRLIADRASLLTQIITRAQQLGLVETSIKPDAAAISLVGVIQGVVAKTYAAPPAKERFRREAAEAWTIYRAALTGSLHAERTI
jgi:uncharacterized protein YndB with AHSA1/START domain